MAAPRPIRSQSYEQVYELVRSAIAAQKPIAAVYKHCRRLFCPYILGRNTEGHPHALCYQIGGQSSSALKPRGSADNWRCFNIEQLAEVELSPKKWYLPPHLSSHQTCIVKIEHAVIS